MKSRKTVFRRMAVCIVLSSALAIPAAAEDFQGAVVENFLLTAKITGMKSINVGVTLPRKATMELEGATHFAVFKVIDDKKSGATQLDREELRRRGLAASGQALDEDQPVG